MTRSGNDWTSRGKSSRSGGSASSWNGWRGWRTARAGGVRLFFPPDVVVQVKALACELPWQTGVPLSRWSRAELARHAVQKGIVATISGSTVWRWLSADAIRPWQHRTWIFPRDPLFAQKAGPVLDLYQGFWQGQPLLPGDCVLSTDEKTSIQARIRCHGTALPEAGRPMRVEHEYDRGGAWAYLAAWDVRRAKVFGRCEPTTGIEPFRRLVAQVMGQEPYRSAGRVFWVMDNGSSHRGEACVLRLREEWPTLVPVHLPVHASWLNQIEVYFSIIQRKVLTPNDFRSLAEVETRLLDFQAHYEKLATPFEWKFTRDDLARLLDKLDHDERPSKVA